jgi:hypothetical protein
MGQRVNIQYSVELEDLQKEVNRLFANAIKELDIISPVGGTASLKLGTDGLDKIEHIRHRLAKIDIMLGDIQNTNSEPEREIPFQQTSEELEMEQLQDKIEMFKKAINENTNSESPV